MTITMLTEYLLGILMVVQEAKSCSTLGHP